MLIFCTEFLLLFLYLWVIWSQLVVVTGLSVTVVTLHCVLRGDSTRIGKKHKISLGFIFLLECGGLVVPFASYRTLPSPLNPVLGSGG